MRRFLIYSLLLVVACGDGGASSTLQYYFTYDPRSLDPALSTDVPTGEVIALLFDNLTQFNTDGDLEPGLAQPGRPIPRARHTRSIFGRVPPFTMALR